MQSAIRQWSRVRHLYREAVALSLRGRDLQHRAGISLGERLLGDVHKPLWRRVAKVRGIRQPARSKGLGIGIQKPIQPPQAAQRFGLLNHGGVCGIARVDQNGGELYEGARINNHTLIAAGTENGLSRNLDESQVRRLWSVDSSELGLGRSQHPLL